MISPPKSSLSNSSLSSLSSYSTDTLSAEQQAAIIARSDVVFYENEESVFLSTSGTCRSSIDPDNTIILDHRHNRHSVSMDLLQQTIDRLSLISTANTQASEETKLSSNAPALNNASSSSSHSHAHISSHIVHKLYSRLSSHADFNLYKQHQQQDDTHHSNVNSCSTMSSASASSSSITPAPLFDRDVMLQLIQADNVHAFHEWCKSHRMSEDEFNNLKDELIHEAVLYDSTAVLSYLLTHGAMIESVDDRDNYTALFSAADGQHTPEIVELLIQHGANLTGEFYFNDETAISISAWKFLCAITTLNEDRIVQWTNNYNAIRDQMSVHAQAATTIVNELWSLSTQHQDQPWLFLADPNIIQHVLQSVTPIYTFFETFYHTVPNATQQQPELLRAFEIFRCVFTAHRICTEKSEIASVCHQYDDSDHHIRAVAYPTSNQIPCIRIQSCMPVSSSPRCSREDVLSSLVLLNTNQAPSASCPLFFAEFRGIHYCTNHFTADQRLMHIFTSHLHRLTPSPAVLYSFNLRFCEWQLARESALEEKAQVTKQIWQQLAEQPSDTHATLQLQYQEAISNDYASDMPDAVRAFMRPAQLERGYPLVAMSDLPIHALRYAAGKPLPSLASYLQLPYYTPTGRARVVILGKVWIALLTHRNAIDERCTKAIHAHNIGQINLRDAVHWEREFGSPGALSHRHLYYEMPVCVPCFDQQHYPTNYKKLFGLSENQWRKWKLQILAIGTLGATQRARVEVEQKLIKAVCKHLAQHLMLESSAEARRRGGVLIFQHGEGLYGMYPEYLRHPSNSEYNMTTEEKQLLEALDRDRFPNESEREAKRQRNRLLQEQLCSQQISQATSSLTHHPSSHTSLPNHS